MHHRNGTQFCCFSYSTNEPIPASTTLSLTLVNYLHIKVLMKFTTSVNTRLRSHQSNKFRLKFSIPSYKIRKQLRCTTSGQNIQQNANAVCTNKCTRARTHTCTVCILDNVTHAFLINTHKKLLISHLLESIRQLQDYSTSVQSGL